MIHVSFLYVSATFLPHFCWSYRKTMVRLQESQSGLWSCLVHSLANRSVFVSPSSSPLVFIQVCSLSNVSLKYDFRCVSFLSNQKYQFCQGQARGNGCITQKGSCPEWANTLNLNNSNGSLFLRAFSGYENLGYFWPFAVGFIHFNQIVFEWEHFEKKFSKICFWSWAEKCDFLKNVKNYSTLTKRCDQTTWPTVNY